MTMIVRIRLLSCGSSSTVVVVVLVVQYLFVCILASLWPKTRASKMADLRKLREQQHGRRRRPPFHRQLLHQGSQTERNVELRVA